MATAADLIDPISPLGQARQARIALTRRVAGQRARPKVIAFVLIELRAVGLDFARRHEAHVARLKPMQQTSRVAKLMRPYP